jgi:hypothetical protein
MPEFKYDHALYRDEMHQYQEGASIESVTAVSYRTDFHMLGLLRTIDELDCGVC